MTTTTTNFYSAKITEILRGIGRAELDPRHVEAWMRCEAGYQGGMLNHLSPEQFAHEVDIAVETIDGSPEGMSETLAQTYGL
jgi:hypothetical protein